MRRHLHAVLILVTSSIGILSSCSTTHVVDPIATPVFTAPWQGNIHVNTTTDDKLFFQGAASLPANFAIVAAREFWGHNRSSNQEMTSIALGKFWPENGVLVLGGFGLGKDRNGPGDVSLEYGSSGSFRSIDGASDYRTYFAQVQLALHDSVQSRIFAFADVEKYSIGLACRVEYLDMYRFNQTELRWGDYSTPPNIDTTISVDHGAKHSLSFDIAPFINIQILFVQFYGQVLLRLPIGGYSDFGDWFVATAGVGVAF